MIKIVSGVKWNEFRIQSLVRFNKIFFIKYSLDIRFNPY